MTSKEIFERKLKIFRKKQYDLVEDLRNRISEETLERMNSDDIEEHLEDLWRELFETIALLEIKQGVLDYE